MKKVMNLFAVVMAVIAMASCAEKKSLEVLGGEWNVVSVGELVVPDSVGAFIGFDLTEQAVYGSTGCNLLTGAMPIEVKPETPMFAALGSTRKACKDMTIEDAMLPALSQVVDFKVEGENLYFLNANGDAVMSLVKR